MNGPNPSKMIQSHGCRLNGEIPVSRYLNGCPFESLTSSTVGQILTLEDFSCPQLE